MQNKGGVVAWTCPRCRRVVGVKNEGTLDVLCAQCRADELGEDDRICFSVTEAGRLWVEAAQARRAERTLLLFAAAWAGERSAA